MGTSIKGSSSFRRTVASACFHLTQSLTSRGRKPRPAVENNMNDPLPDSGQRRSFATGSVRDDRTGKGRYDLIPPEAIRELAIQLEKGCAKYGERNWEKGQPMSCFLDSGIRHLMRYLAGDRDEDHLRAALWNVAAAVTTRERIFIGKLDEKLWDLPGEPR